MIMTVESRDITSMRASVNERGKHILKLESDQTEVWIIMDEPQFRELALMISETGRR